MFTVHICIYWKKSAYMWTHAGQILIVQGSAVFPLAIFFTFFFIMVKHT